MAPMLIPRGIKATYITSGDMQTHSARPWQWPANKASDFLYLHLTMELTRKVVKSMPRRCTHQGVKITYVKPCGGEHLPEGVHYQELMARSLSSLDLKPCYQLYLSVALLTTQGVYMVHTHFLGSTV